VFRRRAEDVIGAVVGLAVLLACGIAASSGKVGPAESRVFHAVNGLPDVLSPPMRFAQLLGVLAVGPIVGVVALILRRWRLAVAAFLVTAGKLVGERIVWQVVQRSRPGTTISDAIVRGDTPTHGAAFVSGHVVLVSGLAWVITPYLRGRWRLLPWLIVLLVAFARCISAPTRRSTSSEASGSASRSAVWRTCSSEFRGPTAPGVPGVPVWTDRPGPP
jgi:hypothetical protein